MSADAGAPAGERDASADCLFCKIAAGTLPSTAVDDAPTTYAFTDINPAAPVHVLVIPRRHVTDLQALGPDDAGLLADLLAAVQRVAGSQGLAERGYRMVANVGPDAGQMVAHLHLHVLGGRRMRWPPE